MLIFCLRIPCAVSPKYSTSDLPGEVAGEKGGEPTAVGVMAVTAGAMAGAFFLVWCQVYCAEAVDLCYTLRATSERISGGVSVGLNHCGGQVPVHFNRQP